MKILVAICSSREEDYGRTVKRDFDWANFNLHLKKGSEILSQIDDSRIFMMKSSKLLSIFSIAFRAFLSLFSDRRGGKSQPMMEADMEGGHKSSSRHKQLQLQSITGNAIDAFCIRGQSSEWHDNFDPLESGKSFVWNSFLPPFQLHKADTRAALCSKGNSDLLFETLLSIRSLRTNHKNKRTTRVEQTAKKLAKNSNSKLFSLSWNLERQSNLQFN